MKKIFKKWVGSNKRDKVQAAAEIPSKCTSNDLWKSRHTCGYNIVINEENYMNKIHIGSWMGKYEDVEQALNEFDVNEVDYGNRTPLHLAVAQGYTKIVSLLLEFGADLEIQDEDGLTPFLKAVDMGNLELVEIFIKHKADINVVDRNGNTALHLSVLYGFIKIIDLLLKNNAIPDIQNKAGDSALNLAIQYEYYDIVELMLLNGCSVNMMDVNVKTPIMTAAITANLKIFDMIMQYNPDLTIRSMNGLTVYDYAEMSKCKGIIEKLNAIKEEEDGNSESAHMEDSSCVSIPPALEPVRSWEVIQSTMKDDQRVESLNGTLGRNDTLQGLEEIWVGNKVKEDVKNTEEVPEAPLRKKHLRCKSLGGFGFTKPTNNNRDKRMSAQFETYNKALNELSLKCTIRGDEEEEVINNDESSKSDSSKNSESLSNKRKILLNMRKDADSPISNKIQHSASSSSDEQLPFWTKSDKFQKQCTVIKKEQDDQQKLNDSSENSESDEKEDLSGPRNGIWNKLKEVTIEKSELEKVTESLKEKTDKLEYNLNNSKEMIIYKDDNINGLNKQITELDDKYTNNMQLMAVLQHRINTLQQQVTQLTQICTEANTTNEQLLKQIKQMMEECKLEQIDKERLINQNMIDIKKLQSDVLYWQNKYEDVVQKMEERENKNDTINRVKLQNDLMDILQSIRKLKKEHSESTTESPIKNELQEIKEKLDTFASKEDLSKIQTEQTQAITQDKLYDLLKQVKMELLQKQDEEEEYEKENQIQKEMENEKMKYTMEISKLKSLLIQRELEGKKLKETCDSLNEQLQKTKEQRRRSLIDKSYNIAIDCNSRRSSVQSPPLPSPPLLPTSPPPPRTAVSPPLPSPP